MTRVRSLWPWAAKKPMVWLNLALAGVTVLIVVGYPGPSDLRIRLFGLVLQGIGIYTVYRDLTRNGRHFGQATVLQSMAQWWREFLGHAEVRGQLIVVETDLDVAWGRASARNQVPPDAPLGERLAALEHNVSQLDNAVASVWGELATARTEHKKALRGEAAAREKQIAELERDLQAVTVGNYTLLLFGVAWLAVGVFLATLSMELWLASVGRWGELWARLA